MNLHWPWQRPVSVRRPTRPAPPAWVNARIDQPPPPPEAEERPLGCGWFDSSHELNHGLQVTEHASPDAVANEVPLGWWIDWATGPMAESEREALRLQ